MQPMRREKAETDHRAALFDLIRVRSFGRGHIKLASGRESDFYFDLRPTTLHPAGATHIGELIVDALEGLAVDYVGGLEMGAVPVATATAIASHGRGRDVGIVILEDVTTTGGSSIQAVDAVKAEGGNVILVLSIVDRQEGAADTFAAAGLKFRALFTAEEFLRA